MIKPVTVILLAVLCSLFLMSDTVTAQSFCGAKVVAPSHPKTVPTDGKNNFFACESGALDPAFKQAAEPDGNLPDNVYVMQFSNGRPLLANKTGTWNTVEQGLVAGDTVFISALTFDIDSLNGLLDRARELCFALTIIPNTGKLCKRIKEIQNGDNDGKPGVQSIEEVISIAESFSEEKIVDLERTVEVLRKLNKNISNSGVKAEVCFTRSYPPLEVLIVEDGSDCFQGDADGDLVDNIMEDTNNNNDLTDDDLDKDGIPNYLDTDDNNDGILTKDHDVDNNGDPTDDDSDADGTPDYLEYIPVSVLDKAIQLRVFPNPNQGVFYIDFTERVEKLKAYNIFGKEVPVVLDGQQAELNNRESGVYVLQINETRVKVFIE